MKRNNLISKKIIYILLTCVLFMSFSIPTHSQVGGISDDSLYKQARSAYESNNWLKAVKLFSEYIKRRPDRLDYDTELRDGVYLAHSTSLEKYIAACDGSDGSVVISYNANLYLPILPSENAPKIKPIVCRGGTNIDLRLSPNRLVVEYDKANYKFDSFDAIESGQCSWLDRGMSPSDPEKIVFPTSKFQSDRFHIELKNGLAKFSPGYINDMQSPNKYHLFYVYDDYTGNLIATKAGSIIYNLTTASRNRYEVSREGVKGGLARNMPVYADTLNHITFKSIPPHLVSSTYIRTANADKFISDFQDRFLTFHTTKETTIYVAFDDTYGLTPPWLRSFERTNDTLELNSGPGTVTLNLYKKAFPAGRVVLGNNYVPMASIAGGLNTPRVQDISMYVVIIDESS